MLDSLVCTVDLYDLIVLKKRKDDLINIEMRGRGLESLPPEKNNAYKAATAYISAFKTGGADVTIYKNIPVGAGLGGSSADAAGVLAGMAKLYGKGSEKQLEELAAGLGSDTPFMVSGGFARMRGRGEILEKLPVKRRLNFLLLMPPHPVGAGECYARYDKNPLPPHSSDRALAALEKGDVREFGGELFNDLYGAAKSINPEIERAMEELKAFDPAGVSMTGSGSAVFALFENEEFCAYAKSRYRGNFQKITVKSGIFRG